MVEVKIGNIMVGDGYPVFIIAEGCDNHMGSLEVAKEMVRQASSAECDAIKFQHHLPDEEMLPIVPMSDNFDIPLYEFLVKNALKLKQHEEIKNYCEQLGIIYLCTPFSWKAAQELNDIGVTAFKIGSGEMTDVPTLERISSYGKPMIVSTGMCAFEGIDRSYYALVKTGVPLALTNCISEYPPAYEDINLGVISKMIARYPKAVIGHSDHTPDLYTSFAAVVTGAKIIEKHVIISKQTPGPDQSVSDFGLQKPEVVRESVKVVPIYGGKLKLLKTSVSLPQSIIDDLRWLARIKGMTSYQSLLREFVSEKIFEEKRRLQLF